MAAGDVIARRYAQALFELATDEGRVGPWREQLERAVSVVTDPDVAATLANPGLGMPRRTELAMSLLEGVAHPVSNLIRLLLERDRIGIARAVLDHYDRLADRASGIVRAEVIGAVAIDEETRRSITATLSRRLGVEVQTEVAQDPSIIGGLIIHIGDRVIDGSVRTRLQQLQGALT